MVVQRNNPARTYVASLKEDMTFPSLGHAIASRFPTILWPMLNPAHPSVIGACTCAMKSLDGVSGSAIPNV
jgi:hypothetical protein